MEWEDWCDWKNADGAQEVAESREVYEKRKSGVAPGVNYLADAVSGSASVKMQIKRSMVLVGAGADYKKTRLADR